MILRVELYGRLRDCGDATEVSVPAAASAREVLEALAAELGRPGLLAGAVLATDERVLGPDEPVPAAARLAALPPVCGG